MNEKNRTMKYVSTVYDEEQKRCRSERELVFAPDGGEENFLLNLYPSMTYQTFEGFGGALTESAGYVYGQMDEGQQREMLEEYFGAGRMNYRMVRIPIDSCDFSLGHCEGGRWGKDGTLEGFSTERMEKNILPLLRDAEKAYGGKLEIMLTPWSPPAFMKTNGERNHGGELKPAYRRAWAEYICEYIKKFRSLGYMVKRISIQNEPHAVQTWDSCIFDGAQEKEFLRDYLWPAMQEHGLTDTEIFIWDHNKERAFERACEVIDETTDAMVAGIAFHWYSGDHFDALSMIHEKFPDKKLILSEACIEYRKFCAADHLKNARKYAHDMIGNLNHGMTGFYDWNVVLDEIGGPNHAGNFCDAPFMFHRERKELMRKNLADYLWHFTHFIKAGAVRIGVTGYSEKLEATAFLNPDGEIAVILLNTGAEEIPVNIRLDSELVKITVEPDSIASGVIFVRSL